MPLGEDILTRIINVHWAEKGIDQQGLLAEYPPGPGAPDFESIQDVMRGTPTAYALETGETFPGINMGASGLGYTVLTRGLICFGKPRDGDACFIACPEFSYYTDDGNDQLRRGIVNDESLVWSNTGSGVAGKLVALTFAVDAFFAVYYEFNESFQSVTRIATSFDGITWSDHVVSFTNEGAVGAVAGRPATSTDGDTAVYVAIGDIDQEDNIYRNHVQNLMWATSSTGLSWSADFDSGMLTEPGSWYSIINNYACTVAAGLAKYVAPAATKTHVVDPDPERPQTPFTMRSAAAAVSEDGSHWTTIALPGALEPAIDQESWGLAVTFCKRKKDEDAHFLLSDHELISGELGHDVPNSNLYRSSDGQSWTKIRTNNNWMSTLSAIALDPSKTTIVTI